MALTKGVNSYATTDEADAYFADRLDVIAWTDASPEMKGQALVTATALLDDMSWTGAAVSVSQPLAWPRVGSYYDPKLGMNLQLKSGEVPNRIVVGCFELAYHLLNNDGLMDSTGGVKELTVGPISLKGLQQVSKTSSAVTSLTAPLLKNGGRGGSMWWRAN